MTRQAVTKLSLASLMIVIFFTILGQSYAQPAFVRGVWLAFVWQAAGVALLAWAGRLLRPPVSRARAWGLAGVGALKFPALYALGYYGMRWCAPSAAGLAVGLTIPWVAVFAWALLQLREPAW